VLGHALPIELPKGSTRTASASTSGSLNPAAGFSSASSSASPTPRPGSLSAVSSPSARGRMGAAGDAIISPCEKQLANSATSATSSRRTAPRVISAEADDKDDDDISDFGEDDGPSSPTSLSHSGRTPAPGLARRHSEKSTPKALLQEQLPSSESSPTRRRNSTGGEPIGNGQKALYDILTIRQWFNGMDEQRNGHVTKKEWLEFMRRNPQFKSMVLCGGVETRLTDRFSEESVQALKDQAKEMRRLLKIWREIDKDANGTLEWEEFIEFFRRSGNLLEYETVDNPKERLAHIVTEIHEGRAEGDKLDEFLDLAKGHLQGERRLSFEKEVALATGASSSGAIGRTHSEPRTDSNSQEKPSPTSMRRRSDCQTYGGMVLT